jgi:hypothetical protein
MRPQKHMPPNGLPTTTHFRDYYLLYTLHVFCTSVNAIGSITSVNAIESAGEMWSRINVHGDGLAFNVHGDGLQLL